MGPLLGLLPPRRCGREPSRERAWTTRGYDWARGEESWCFVGKASPPPRRQCIKCVGTCTFRLMKTPARFVGECVFLYSVSIATRSLRFPPRSERRRLDAGSTLLRGEPETFTSETSIFVERNSHALAAPPRVSPTQPACALCLRVIYEPPINTLTIIAEEGGGEEEKYNSPGVQCTSFAPTNSIIHQTPKGSVCTAGEFGAPAGIESARIIPRMI